MIITMLLMEQEDMRHFATVYSEESGICIDLFSDQTGTQFYSGNFIGEQMGKGGFAYHNRSGLCLEPQYIPNAMNFIPEGEILIVQYLMRMKHYHSESIYKFSIK